MVAKEMRTTGREGREGREGKALLRVAKDAKEMYMVGKNAKASLAAAILWAWPKIELSAVLASFVTRLNLPCEAFLL
jgi:hypothetical protein